MKTVGIRDLKNNLSRYLSRVKRGEEILVTERGRTIARIVQEPARETSLRDRLAPLVSEGTVSLPKKELDRDPPAPRRCGGKRPSEIVVEGRR